MLKFDWFSVLLSAYILAGLISAGHFLAHHAVKKNGGGIDLIAVTVIWPGYVSYEYFRSNKIEPPKDSEDE